MQKESLPAVRRHGLRLRRFTLGEAALRRVLEGGSAFGTTQARAQQLCVAGLDHFDDHAVALENLAAFRHSSQLFQQVAVEGTMLQLREGRIEEVIDVRDVCLAVYEYFAARNPFYKLRGNVFFINDLSYQLFQYILKPYYAHHVAVIAYHKGEVVF